MRTLWTSDLILEATDGKGRPDIAIDSVVIDSRKVSKGALFVALKGEHFDGHSFVSKAFEAGAVAALVSDTPYDLDAQDPRLIYVENTETALQDIGVAARARYHGKVVGVTGSVGKTGTKEMLRTTLGALGKVYATEGNYNNHLGVPMTLANLPTDADFAVFEMGMNHAGEITLLSEWVQPHVSIITTVEEAHMEFFDSIGQVADAKAEIFDGMNESGIAILNADNDQFDRLFKHAHAKGLDRVITFGTGKDALCKMGQYRLEGLQSVVDAVVLNTPITYRMSAIGKHWGLTSCAVLGAVEALGLDLARAAEALEGFTEPAGRGRIEELKVKGGYLHVIDDSYNASPSSMRAAFEKLYALRESDRKKPKRRTVAVLGDMLELGERAHDLHVGLVPSLVNNQIDLVFAAGTFMKDMYEALPEHMQGDYDLTAADLGPKVAKHLRDRDLVLVKGSRGSRMEEVIESIRKSNPHKEA